MGGVSRDAAGVAAAVVTFWVVAVVVGLAVAAVRPPADATVPAPPAGLPVGVGELPGTLLGLVFALYVFRAVSRPARSTTGERPPSTPTESRTPAPAPRQGSPPVAPSPAPRPQPPAVPPKPARSDALTLLETLQREARLIDFLKEDIAPYDDAQVGAAVRDIHRDGGKTLERLFALRPVLDAAEGDAVSLDPSQAGKVRLVGNVREGATTGTLTHHGWTATKAELPTWSGPKAAERVVAPAEVEVA